MQLIKDFTGCSAVIRYADSDDILDRAPIIGYNRSTLTITVSSSKVAPSEKQVSILILGNALVYEYGGVVRKAPGTNVVEISLFKGKLKRGREAIRYDLNKPATVYVAKNDGKEKPYEVTIVNVSVSGVLLKANSSAFDEGDVFKLNVCIGVNPTMIAAKVVRKIPVSAAYSQYGCELIAVVDDDL